MLQPPQKLRNASFQYSCRHLAPPHAQHLLKDGQPLQIQRQVSVLEPAEKQLQLPALVILPEKQLPVAPHHLLQDGLHDLLSCMGDLVEEGSGVGEVVGGEQPAHGDQISIVVLVQEGKYPPFLASLPEELLVEGGEVARLGNARGLGLNMRLEGRRQGNVMFVGKVGDSPYQGGIVPIFAGLRLQQPPHHLHPNQLPHQLPSVLLQLPGCQHLPVLSLLFLPKLFHIIIVHGTSIKQNNGEELVPLPHLQHLPLILDKCIQQVDSVIQQAHLEDGGDLQGVANLQTNYRLQIMILEADGTLCALMKVTEELRSDFSWCMFEFKLFYVSVFSNI